MSRQLLVPLYLVFTWVGFGCANCREIPEVSGHPLVRALDLATSEQVFANNESRPEKFLKIVRGDAGIQLVRNVLERCPSDIDGSVVLLHATFNSGVGETLTELVPKDSRIRLLSANVLVMFKVKDRLGFVSNFQMMEFDESDIRVIGYDGLMRGYSATVDGVAGQFGAQVGARATNWGKKFDEIVRSAKNLEAITDVLESNDSSVLHVLVSSVNGQEKTVGGMNVYLIQEVRGKSREARLSELIDAVFLLWRRGFAWPSAVHDQRGFKRSGIARSPR